ncbi:Tyrosine recombinase XerC [Paraburkholderia nemoris]|uniref:site-specific integrase n=1 Tax=Paraburkholderia nemoris TaxID=2793076 RepID=UPI00190D807B|nr:MULTISPECIES: site-specific integrase [Paraburkholderia]MBK3786295.1 tyrosine-type recombinase/integrase [Paraburkholderia aspalathi]CAE6850754.1 Tyrosine recombinase XerC [Paraburkholderia nemoris]
MSDLQTKHDTLLDKLKQHLVAERYCVHIRNRYLAVAANFLRFLDRRRICVDATQPSHISAYLQCELRRFRHRHGHSPLSARGWRASHTTGIHQLLRLAIGKWPPDPPTSSVNAKFDRALCMEYGQWLREWRGLATETVDGHLAEAQRFLCQHGRCKGADTLMHMTITDIDVYLQSRVSSLRRVSRKDIALRLRSFVRYLYDTGRTGHDLSQFIIVPRIYARESIPSTLRPADISAVLRFTREDRSPTGLRDYAILMMLSKYGIRAGEIARLRLEDIDWRADRFCIRHTKTGSQSILPLLPSVGEALLDYLRRGRPITNVREIFVRARAPYRGFRNGSSLYTPVRRRLESAGVHPTGKRGPHAFRHARAVSLLRADVSVKTIGDLLGHRSAESTGAYLKLATEHLRAVALEVPNMEKQP